MVDPYNPQLSWSCYQQTPYLGMGVHISLEDNHGERKYNIDITILYEIKKEEVFTRSFVVEAFTVLES